jgi:CxxC-x17-CxxC domain-containing protein
MEYRDKTLSCADCQQPFVWSSGEQLFFADKKFKNEPKRCKECKARRSPDGPRSSQLRNGNGRVETAVRCSECGKDTTIPFKPTQGRPVYCKDCFSKRAVHPRI